MASARSLNDDLTCSCMLLLLGKNNLLPRLCIIGNFTLQAKDWRFSSGNRAQDHGAVAVVGVVNV